MLLKLAGINHLLIASLKVRLFKVLTLFALYDSFILIE